MGYYKEQQCSLATFSDDGSVLAVAFGKTLTLWDPLENHLCSCIDQESDITALEFCSGTQSNCLAVANSHNVILWDLLDYSGEDRF